MKKLCLMFIPFAAVSLLTNCNKRNPYILDNYTWEQIKEISDNYNAPEVFKIGDKKKVQLKTQDLNDNGKIDKGEYYQTVRIIGFNHDFIEEETIGKYKTIGITFEFADKICDPFGLSLSTYWNDFHSELSEPDKQEIDYNASLHYENSSVRAALIGEQNEAGKLNWYRYYGVQGETEPYDINYYFVKKGDPCYKKSVWDMLPDDLQKVITSPWKEVLDYDNDKKTLMPTWLNDPLFLLSPREVGYDGGIRQEATTFTYRYYQGHTGLVDRRRIKTQMNNTSEANKVEKNVKDGEYKEARPLPDWKSFSHAGCRTNPSQCINPSWLRTPQMYDKSSCAYCIEDNKGRVDAHNVRQYANGIAPAFCI